MTIQKVDFKCRFSKKIFMNKYDENEKNDKNRHEKSISKLFRGNYTASSMERETEPLQAESNKKNGSNSKRKFMTSMRG